MLSDNDFCINRKAAPGLDLKDFIQMVADLNIKYVELRNDITGRVANSTILDGYQPEEIKQLLDEKGIEVVDINAQGNMDLAQNLDENLSSLEEMISIGRVLNVKNILFCPVRDANDSRTGDERRQGAIDNMKVYSKVLKANGMSGLLEPLGFVDATLQTPWLAQDVIKAANVDNFKLVADNFHYYLADVTEHDFATKVDPFMVGLVHLSSVVNEKPRADLDDADRVMLEENDIMHVNNFVKMIENSTYNGLYSFEPFSPDLSNWGAEKAKKEIIHSIDLINAE
ncbi:TIM barrel protein [Lactobacillus xylocopicola]|uniref:Xylose isomerase-like TIM barrel domain-containing protein n=1 Tax=Lactobacillus xylocopicola TaxID=2976676 RepID=A0ABM8BFC2_9LACO|nr:TIM barrel protein [Lactobacillus xylocopicola]BDR59927.1 hypothetical protein KIM322_01880 [Lactobacillus xylocopicola]